MGGLRKLLSSAKSLGKQRVVPGESLIATTMYLCKGGANLAVSRKINDFNVTTER
jgi:hypothetical protein